MMLRFLGLFLLVANAYGLTVKEFTPKSVKILGFDQRQVRIQLPEGKTITLPRTDFPSSLDLRPNEKLEIPVKSNLWKKVQEAETAH